MDATLGAPLGGNPMKWTLSGICYYLIWFFAVGTTACTTMQYDRIGRSQFELLAHNQSKSSYHRQNVIHTLDNEKVQVCEHSELYVDRNKTDGQGRNEQKLRLPITPFSFTIDENVIKPITTAASQDPKDSITLLATDRFVVGDSQVDGTKVVLITSGVIVGLAGFMLLSLSNSY
jgi:hypothetical protein